MGEGLVLYDTDDTTPLAPIAFTPDPTPDGTVSAAVAFHLWNDKGSPTGTYLWGGKLRLLADDGTGAYVESGIPFLDKRELQMRITGSANPGADPLFVARVATPWQSIGNGVLFDFGNMRPNCAVYGEVRYAPGIRGATSTTPDSWILEPIYNQWSTPLLSAETGILCRGADEWVIAPLATASGSPDDVVSLSRGSLTGLGVSRRWLATSGVLNQNDSAAAALGSGEAYEALISYPLSGGAPVFTKGAKAVAGSTVLPALPANSLSDSYVHVSYQAGGTSVITSGDITQLATDGRGEIGYSASSFDVTLGAIRTLTGTTLVDRPAATLTLDPSVTTVIYLATDGSWSTTGGMPFWSVTTDGSGVTGTPIDLRSYLGGRRVTLKARGALTAPTTALDHEIVTEPCSIDRLYARIRVAGGASGSTDLDVNLNGSSIFGTAPSIPYGSLTADCWPTTTVLAAGDALTLDADAVTGGGTEADAEIVAWVY